MRGRNNVHLDGEVSDAKRAADDLKQRDRIIAERIRDEARMLGVEIIEVDGSVSIEELTGQIKTHFGLQ